MNQWSSIRLLVGMLTILISGVLGAAVLFNRGPLVFSLNASRIGSKLSRQPISWCIKICSLSLTSCHSLGSLRFTNT